MKRLKLLRQQNMSKKRIIIVTIFIILTIVSIVIGADMNLISSLFAGDKIAWTNFIHGRLPRTMVIILAASALSVAGLIMQSLSRNKFISPQTAGTTDAAGLGVLLSMVFFGSQSIYLRFSFAFIFAMASSILFMILLSKIKFKNIVYVPLIGMMYGALIGSVTTLIAHKMNMLQVVASLNLGSFSKITLLNSSLLIILIPALVLAFIYATAFSIISLGEDFSINLGINYKATMFIGLIIVAIVSAAVYIVVGPLPFLGLIIPNIVTMYYGDHVKKNLVDVAIFGSTFVLLNDIVSRLIRFPYEISVGLTMGVTGAIIFLFLIFKKVNANE